ncbi:SNP29-like protein, partial [Mya arenaria]
MSNSVYTSSNPFDEDEDGYRNKHNRPSREKLSQEEQIQRMMQEIEDSEARQLESTRRALASIDESERMGVATAEELLQQREQLKNIEIKTGKINQDLKTSQKHITSIGSIFGGIKNWWNGDKEKEPAGATPTEKKGKLEQTLEHQSTSRPHPAERYKTDDGHGFYEEDLDSKFMKGARKPEPQQYFKPITNSSKEQRLNENLDMMSEGMSRLKGLAIGLGDEIETHNELLDRINTKVDRADIKLKDQNKQMR